MRQNISEQELKDVIAKAGYDAVAVNCEPYEKTGIFGIGKKGLK